MQDVKDQFVKFWKESGKERIFKVRGTSMRPFIRDTDNLGIITVRHANELHIGDIVLFQVPAGMVAHRIVGKTNRNGCIYFSEKGDRALQPKMIQNKKIIGKVVHVYRSGSTVDLTRGTWLIVNKIAGYYWCYLAAAYKILYTQKQRLLGAKKYPHLTAAFSKLYLFLNTLPNKVFNRTNR